LGMGNNDYLAVFMLKFVMVPRYFDQYEFRLFKLFYNLPTIHT